MHAPLRLISWCSFELNQVARRLLRDLAVLCEEPTTTTKDLVDKIALRNTHVQNERDATQYLATLATVHIASRAQMPTYKTMVQHFLGTLQLPMAIYMLDYYLPMLSPNEGYNETGLTMQSAGPVREPWQPVELEFQFKGIASLDIGKSREDAMHSHSDTQAWAKQMSTTYWKAKRTITRSVPWVLVDSLQWLESWMPQPKMPEFYRSYHPDTQTMQS